MGPLAFRVAAIFFGIQYSFIVVLVLGIFALGAILSESARPVHILEQEISGLTYKTSSRNNN